MNIGDKCYKEGDIFSQWYKEVTVYDVAVSTVDASENPRFVEFMTMVDKYRRLGVRTNADTLRML